MDLFRRVLWTLSLDPSYTSLIKIIFTKTVKFGILIVKNITRLTDLLIRKSGKNESSKAPPCGDRRRRVWRIGDRSKTGTRAGRDYVN